MSNPRSYALYVGKRPTTVFSPSRNHTIMPGEMVGVFFETHDNVGIRKLGNNGEVVSTFSTSCSKTLLRMLSPLELLALQAEENTVTKESPKRVNKRT